MIEENQRFTYKKDAAFYRGVSEDKKVRVFFCMILGGIMGLCVFTFDYDIWDQNS